MIGIVIIIAKAFASGVVHLGEDWFKFNYEDQMVVNNQNDVKIININYLVSCKVKLSLFSFSWGYSVIG